MSRLKRPTIETDAGTEIRCSKCNEFWPIDPEFYFIHKTRGPHSWCKACYLADPKVIAKRQRSLDKLATTRATRRMATTSQNFQPGASIQ